jgi:predicted ATPase/DNA-binding XRE family transcriptional regulator
VDPNLDAPHTFGALLRQYRVTASLTQEALGERAHLSAAAIAALERGRRIAPRPGTVLRLAQALHLTRNERAGLIAAATSGPTHGGTMPTMPTVLTSFVGRERELADLNTALRTSRLLTLTGGGGVGKTRLVVELVRRLGDGYRDGVAFVDLAPLADPGLVPEAAAAAVGVEQQPGRTLSETLAHVLRDRELLLILDNCEHLLKASAALATVLLHDTSQVRVLATSRERLGLVGETVWRLPSLSLPDPDAKITAAALNSSDATRLFVERANAVVPGLTLTNPDAVCIVDICRRIEGLPLAIELAAARMVVMSAAQIAERLHDALRVLVTHRRSAPLRHQTLRAALTWSYSLLSRAEQRVFERLAVFAGGWSLEAAESVCAGGDIERDDVVDLLERLVERSLVQCERLMNDSVVRFRLLETVRQYAQERLAEAGGLQETHGRHAAFFLELVAEADAALAEHLDVAFLGAAHSASLAQLVREHDNLRTALRWAIDSGSARMAYGLGVGLMGFWSPSGYAHEGRTWLDRILTLPDDDAHPIDRARLLVGASVLVMGLGDVQTAQTYTARALALEHELQDDVRYRAGLLYVRGALAHRTGDTNAAHELLRKGVELARSANSGGQLAIMSLQALAEASLSRGDAAGARHLAARALEMAGAHGFPHGRGMALLSLGTLSYQLGDLKTARQHLKASASVGREVGRGAWWLTYALMYYAHVAIDDADYGAARAALRESLERWQELGSHTTLARVLGACAHLAAAEGRAVQALQLAGAAEQARNMSRRPLLTGEHAA